MAKNPPHSLSQADVARIIEALGNSKYSYRTAHGIARESKIDDKSVVEVLRVNPSVRVSITKSPDGSTLYALKNKVSATSDVWNAFKAVNVAKFGS